MKNIINLLDGNTLLPVVTPHSVEQTLNISEKLLAKNINIIEITLRTPAALEAIKAVKDTLPNMIVAAGTVTNSRDLHAVIDAKVDFAVSPATSPHLYDAIKEVGDFAFLPGVATPTEVLTGLEYGYEYFKLFPAQAIGGLQLLKSLSAPLPQAKFCPTGGINAKNVDDYMNLSNVFCVGGSWMVEE